MSQIERAFARIAEGQVHMRRIDRPGDARLPLVMLHASPGSSSGLVPLMEALAAVGGPPLIALDTLGNGDSAPPAPDEPDIAYFADAALRALSAIGVERFDLFGSYTGARSACEMAILAPDRIGALIFDGMGEFSAEQQALFLRDYAPEMVPDHYGRQFVWAFNFVRDQALHFPYFLRDPAHRLMTRAVPDAEELHLRAIEVLKGLGSYHKSYRAAFRYPSGARMPLVTRPATLFAPAGDASALSVQQAYVASMPAARIVEIDASPVGKAKAILASL